MIVIDGKDLIVGRTATFAAKKALLGEEVNIINCEQMYVTGDKEWLIGESQRKRDRGTWAKGPFYFRMPDRYVRRVVRGMLPYKTPRGATAFKKIKGYIGTPDEFKGKAITVPHAAIKKVPNLKYMKVSDLCKALGGKFE